MYSPLFGTKQYGFTLVELLATVAVVGILASVVYGSFSAARERARDTERVTEIEQLRVALRLYADREGAYPSGHDSGSVIGEVPTSGITAIILPLLSDNIQDPSGSSSDTTYEYVYDTSFSCGGTNRIVLYAKTMERPGAGNWTTVCGTAVPGSTNTYGVILR